MSSPGEVLTKEQIRANEVKQAKFLAAQRAAALSPVNCWFAGEKLGHSPNEGEAMMHFAIHGGAARFRHDYDCQQAEQMSA